MDEYYGQYESPILSMPSPYLLDKQYSKSPDFQQNPSPPDSYGAPQIESMETPKELKKRRVKRKRKNEADFERQTKRRKVESDESSSSKSSSSEESSSEKSSSDEEEDVATRFTRLLGKQKKILSLLEKRELFNNFAFQYNITIQKMYQQFSKPYGNAPTIPFFELLDNLLTENDNDLENIDDDIKQETIEQYKELKEKIAIAKYRHGPLNKDHLNRTIEQLEGYTITMTPIIFNPQRGTPNPDFEPPLKKSEY